jgi:hypothetical protein
MEFLFGRYRATISIVIAAVFAAASLLPSAVVAADDPEYLAIKQRLARGWNTSNTGSAVPHSLLPEGFSINLAFKQVKWLGDHAGEG